MSQVSSCQWNRPWFVFSVRRNDNVESGVDATDLNRGE
jgi:hypothetical protein